MSQLSNLSPERRARLEEVYRRTELQKAEERRREADGKGNKPMDGNGPVFVPPTPLTSDVNIIKSDKYWTINGVDYRGTKVNVNLLKTFLDNGASRTQDEWVKYSLEAKRRGDFYTPSYPLFYSTLRAVIDNCVI